MICRVIKKFAKYLIALLTLISLTSTPIFGQNVFVVKDIVLQGNKRTKSNVLLRELPFEIGDTILFDFWLDLKVKGEWRLNNLNLFNQVEIQLDSNDLGIINILVVEKWFDWLIPFISFSDRNFNIWNSFQFDLERTNYGLYLFNYNFLGRNHTIKTSFIQGYNQRYSIEYIAPFIHPKSDIGISAKIAYDEQKEIWYKTEKDILQFFSNQENAPINHTYGYLKAHKRILNFVDINSGVYAKRIRITDDFQNNIRPIPYITGNTLQWQKGVSIGAKYIMVDNVNLPSKGVMWQFESKLEVIGSEFNNHEMTNLILDAMYQQHFQHSKKWFSSVGAKMIYNSQSSLPYPMQRILGYEYYVRGLEPYVVDGQWGGIGKIAAKYQWLNSNDFKLNWLPIKAYRKVSIQSFLECFIDVGYVNNPIITHHFDNQLPNNMLYAIGLGSHFLIYNDKVVRLEGSLNNLQKFGVYLHFERPLR